MNLGMLVATDAFEQFDESEYDNGEMVPPTFSDVYSVLHPEYELVLADRRIESWLGSIH